jgi:hypothetical protein
MKFNLKLIAGFIFAFSSLTLGHILNKKPTDAQGVRGQFINNLLSGKCIDVDGAPGRNNGARLHLWDCELSGRNADNGSPTDQQWKITSDGFIRNTLSGKCIDVAGAPGRNNGARLQLWDCELSGRNADNGSPTDQQWKITSDGFIKKHTLRKVH